MTVKEATELCLKVMSKTMDTTKLGSEKRASRPVPLPRSSARPLAVPC